MQLLFKNTVNADIFFELEVSQLCVIYFAQWAFFSALLIVHCEFVKIMVIKHRNEIVLACNNPFLLCRKLHSIKLVAREVSNIILVLFFYLFQ